MTLKSRLLVCLGVLSVTMGQTCGVDNPVSPTTPVENLYYPPAKNLPDTNYDWEKTNSTCLDLWAGTNGESANDEKLVIGGNPNATYCSWYQLDTERLPSGVNKFAIYLKCQQILGDQATAIDLDRVIEPWVWKVLANGGWLSVNDFPTTASEPSQRYPAPSVDKWSEFDLTKIYNAWQAGQYQNYGVRFRPAETNNGWDIFVSANIANPDNVQIKTDIRGGIAPYALTFPLSGKFSRDRVTGYHFGDWWENETCSGNAYDPNHRLHTGSDFHANAGDPVYAVANGIIKYANTDNRWGGYFCIEYLDTGGKTCTAIYEHVIPLDKFRGKIGATVDAGKQIGTIYPATMAHDGWIAHLHFGKRNKPYDDFSLRGRLPLRPCATTSDPVFPDGFVDPETLYWQQ